MKICAQKTEFQGEFGAGDENKSKKQIKQLNKSIKLPGLDRYPDRTSGPAGHRKYDHLLRRVSSWKKNIQQIKEIPITTCLVVIWA